MFILLFVDGPQQVCSDVLAQHQLRVILFCYGHWSWNGRQDCGTGVYISLQSFIISKGKTTRLLEAGTDTEVAEHEAPE